MRKLDYKRPMMFYQHGKGHSDSYNNGPRVRIIYPNGNVEWASLAFSGLKFNNSLNDAYTFGTEIPCYLLKNEFKNSKTAIDFINRYDKNLDYKPMEFLGYL